MPLRNFEASRRNRRPHASFLCKSVPVSAADMMAVLDLIDEGAEQNVASKFDRLANGKTLLFCHRFYEKSHSLSSDASVYAGVLFPSASASRSRCPVTRFCRYQ